MHKTAKGAFCMTYIKQQVVICIEFIPDFTILAVLILDIYKLIRIRIRLLLGVFMGVVSNKNFMKLCI
jgi:hypothetical protein